MGKPLRGRAFSAMDPVEVDDAFAVQVLTLEPFWTYSNWELHIMQHYDAPYQGHWRMYPNSCALVTEATWERLRNGHPRPSGKDGQTAQGRRRPKRKDA